MIELFMERKIDFFFVLYNHHSKMSDDKCSKCSACVGCPWWCKERGKYYCDGCLTSHKCTSTVKSLGIIRHSPI